MSTADSNKPTGAKTGSKGRKAAAKSPTAKSKPLDSSDKKGITAITKHEVADATTVGKPGKTARAPAAPRKASAAKSGAPGESAKAAPKSTPKRATKTATATAAAAGAAVTATSAGKKADAPAKTASATEAPATPPVAKTQNTAEKTTSVPPVSGQTAAKPDADKAQPAASATSSTPAKRAEPTPAPTVVKKTGFWPTALGGAVAAGLGAGATIWALPQLPDNMRPAALSAPAPEPAPAIDLDALKSETVTAATEAARAEITSGLENISAEARAGATEAAQQATAKALAEMPQAVASLPALQSALQAQSERIDALSTAISAQPAPVARPAAPTSTTAPQGTGTDAMAAIPAPPDAVGDDSLAQQAAAAETQLAATIGALQAQIERQAAQIAELSARPTIDPAAVEQVQSFAANAGELQAQIDAAAASAQEQITAAQTQAQALQAESDAAAQRAQGVASIAALKAALEAGGSPQEAVSQMQDAGIEVPEALQNAEIPSLEDLQTSFAPAARTALKASLRDGAQSDGAFGVVSNFLRAQTGARSVTPRDGADADAVLSRAGAAVTSGDLGAALTEITTLPEPGQAALADWTTGATAYLNAQQAIDAVSATLN